MKHTPKNQDYIENHLSGVHSPDKCKGTVCVIHNPSGHHMHEWSLHYRDDRGIMERVCKHGVGHPDPDCSAAQKDSIHGCDGCCANKKETKMNLTTLRKELTDNKFDDASFVSGVETALDYVFLLMEREQLSNAAKVIDDIEVDDILDFFLHNVYPHIEK